MNRGNGPKVIELYKKGYLWRAWKKRPKPLILLELRAFRETVSQLIYLLNSLIIKSG